MEVLLALVLSVSSATRHEADRLAAKAKAERRAGSPKVALSMAERAYQLVAKPAYLLEIAEDHLALSEWSEAASAYQRFLATHPGGAARAAARKGLAQAKSHQGGGGGLAAAPLAPAPLGAAPLSPAPLAPAPLASAAPPPEAAMPPPPIVQVEPPPPGPAPAAVATQSAPPASVGEVGEVEQQAPKHRSHGLAYGLIGVAAACAVVAVIGWAQVSSFNGSIGQIGPGNNQGSVWSGRYNSANTWQDLAIATSIAAPLAGGGAALAW